MRKVEPQVFLIGETRIIEEGLKGYLDYVGVPEWTSDAPTDVERAIEVMGRLCYRSWKPGMNPNVTKVVVDRDGFAMYFSRAPIPFTRAGQPAAAAWRHVGLYVYRRSCLLRLAALPQTALERAEALEQLRALEHGIRIKAVETTHDTVGVDTPDDLERVRRLLAAESRV